MTPLAAEAKAGIDAFKKAEPLPRALSNLLEGAFNPEATSRATLFQKSSGPRRDRDVLEPFEEGNNGKLPNAGILAIAFSYAPQELCDAMLKIIVSMPPQKAVPLVTQHWTSLFSNNKTGFYNLYIGASKKSREGLSLWLQGLAPTFILQVFAEQDAAFFRRSIDVLRFKEPETAKNIIAALAKLPADQRKIPFKTEEGFTGLVDIMATIQSEDTALRLLELLAPLSATDLRSLFTGRPSYTSREGGEDNLMRRVVRLSPAVINKTLTLLSRLDAGDISNMLVSRGGDGLIPRTPLEASFAAKKFDASAQVQLAKTFIDLLVSQKLDTVLTKSPTDNSESFLHFLVRNGHTPAVAYYLEHPAKLPRQHKNSRGDTPLSLAINAADTGLVSLFKFQDLCDALGESEATTATIFEDTLTKFPKLLDYQDSEGKTLAHRAVLANRPKALQILLDKKAPLTKDKEGFSPLDYAMNGNGERLDSLLILAAHPESKLSQVRKDGNLPLPLLIKQAHQAQTDKKSQYFAIIHETLNNLQAAQTDEAQLSFAAAIRELPEARVSESGFHDQLLKANATDTLSQLVQDHCAASNDVRMLFLQKMGEQLGKDAPPSLMVAASTFVRKELNSASPWSLLVLLFAMKPEVLSQFIKTLSLSPAQKQALDDLLVTGLGLAPIFAKLSKTELQNLQSFLSKKALESLASNHLKYAKLYLLPPEILQDYVKLMSDEDMRNHCEFRLNPTLLVLSLAKECNKAEANPSILSTLFTKLGKELDLLNQEPLPASIDANELLSVLNLATNPQVKTYLKDYLAKQGDTAAIHQHIQGFFANFTKSFSLLPNGLLRELYLEEAKKPQSLNNEKSQQALIDLLSIANKEEVTSVLDAQQQALQHHFWHDALRPHQQLPAYLLALKTKTTRIPLTTFVAKSNELNQQLDALIKSAELETLTPALKSLVKTLSQLTESLIAYQLQPATPSLTDKLLKTLSAFQNGSLALKDKVSCLDSDFAEKLSETLATLENQHLAKEAEPMDLRARIKTLDDIVSQGIKANADKEALLPTLTNWQLSQGYLASETSLIGQFQDLAKTANPATLKQLADQADPLLHLSEQAKLLQDELRQLSQNDPSPEEVINFLCKVKGESLNAFLSLCTKAQCAGLQGLVDFVVAARKEQWQAFVFQGQTPEEQIGGQWLKDSLHKLDDFVGNAASIAALVAGVNPEHTSDKARLEAFSQQFNRHQIPLSAEAIASFANGYQHLVRPTENEDASTLESFVSILNTLMQACTAKRQSEVLARINPDLIQALIEHCLSGVASEDPIRAETCKTMVTNLCQQADLSHEDSLIKRLGAQDLDLLKFDTLKRIAEKTLEEKKDLEGATLDGVWILRLLRNPYFVAGCKEHPEIFERLIERYRALSLLLKQDEFDSLTNFLAGKTPAFAEQHKEAFQRWQKERLNNPKARGRLEAKRKSLLEFRATDSLGELNRQLEDNCLALQAIDPETADRALDVLHNYHRKQLGNLRSDLIFRLSNYIVTRFTRGKGDLPQQSPFISWLKEHFPHRNFHEEELMRKTQVLLYNDQGEQIGYLSEANHAFALVQDEPVSLLEVPGWGVGSVLYDDNRQRLGVLTEEGRLKKENIFQKHTSALLIGKMPKAQLEQVPAAVDLLLQDIIAERTFDKLYESCREDAEKTSWLQAQMAKHITDEKKVLSPLMLSTFVNTHSINNLLDVMNNSRNLKNAEQLFKAILEDPIKRDALLRCDAEKLATLFATLPTQQVLEDFLAENYMHTWFAEGLNLFAKFAKQTGEETLFPRALEALQKRVADNTLTQNQFDDLLKSLIGNAKVAQVILDSGNDISTVYAKSHIMDLLRELNAREAWDNYPEYQLLLTIFKNRQDALFPAREEDLPEQLLWSSDDLRELTLFINHLGTHSGLDPDGELKRALLAQLVFRSAHSGKPDMFFTSTNTINEHIAGAHLARSTLDTLAARYYVVRYAKDTIVSWIDTVKSWFGAGRDEPVPESLKDNHAIIDWKAMETASWAQTENAELPLIAAFLINYKGEPKPISTLLNALCSNDEVMKNPSILTNISQVMIHYPHRDISKIIFSTLEATIVKTPERVNKDILENLLRFSSKVGPGEDIPSETKQAWVSTYGLQKQYKLAEYCAEILYEPPAWWIRFLSFFGLDLYTGDPINKAIGQAQVEARVENDLEASMGTWYFPILKTLSRWWNYGYRGMKNPSGLVTFCDAEAPPLEPSPLPKVICLPSQGLMFSEELEKAPINAFEVSKGCYESYFKKLQDNDTKPQPVPGADMRDLLDLGFFAGPGTLPPTEEPAPANGLGYV